MTTKSNFYTPFYRRIIHFLNDYSLVVSIGCVSTAYFFLRFFEQPISGTFLWLLGSSTWFIFTLDHWMDARTAKGPLLASRHIKHARHERILLLLVSLISGFNLMHVWLHRHEPYIIPGIAAAAFLAVYFILVHNGKSVFRSKEVFVAVGATIGMAVLPAFVQPMTIHASQVFLWVLFGMIHLINIFTFSRFSLQEDLRSGTPSRATQIGFKRLSKSIFNLIVLTYLFCVLWIILFNNPYEMLVSLIVLLMLNGLALINFRYYAFKKHDLYRFWGDALYVIPGGVMWALG